jgi:hypothetical protein
MIHLHHIKTLCIAAWQKKVARNAPKRHSSHLCRAGLFVPVVAQPIQDMSEVSITHKTVGIRLPRLWRCAIKMANKASDKIPPGPQLDILSFLLNQICYPL